MSELDTDAGASGEYRDPQGAASIGEDPGSYYPVEDHTRCIVYCLHPPRRGRSRRRYCPSCSNRLVVRDMADHGQDIEPEHPWTTRLAWFLAAWWAAFLDGLDQFRRRPDPDIELPCPLCDHEDWQQLSRELLAQCGQHGAQADPPEDAQAV